LFLFCRTADRDVHDDKEEEHYEELQSQDAVNPAVTYSRLHPTGHDAVQHQTVDGNYEEAYVNIGQL